LRAAAAGELDSEAEADTTGHADATGLDPRGEPLGVGRGGG